MKKYRTYLIDLGFGAVVYIIWFIWNNTVQKGYQAAGNSLGSLSNLNSGNISVILGFRNYLYGSITFLVILLLILLIYTRSLIFKKNIKKFFVLNFKWLPINVILLAGTLAVCFGFNFLASSIASMFYLNDVLYGLLQNSVYLFLSFPLVLFVFNISYLVYIKDSVKLGIDEVFKRKWYFRLLKSSFVFLILAIIVALTSRTGYYIEISLAMILLFFAWQKESIKKLIN